MPRSGAKESGNAPMDTTLTPPSAPPTSTADVKRLVKQVRAKATQGTVTTADWRALAGADPGRARKELTRYLASYDAAEGPNPFAARSRSFGMLIGFLVGLALTVVIWIVMPPLHVEGRRPRPRWHHHGVDARCLAVATCLRLVRLAAGPCQRAGRRFGVRR
jgi:hypothetical protein